MSGFFFDIHQGVDVPRVQDDGFLTDDIGTEAQAVPCMSVMQIVRCANGDIVDVDAFLQEFSIMSVEKFLLGEEGCLREIGVHDAYRIAFVISGEQVIPGIFDSLQMTWCDIPAHTDDCKVLHIFNRLSFSSL